MAKIIILGASFGGLSSAFECKDLLGSKAEVTVISNFPYFHFVPSNPWVGVGWRTRKDTTFELEPLLKKHGINFVCQSVEEIKPKDNKIVTADGTEHDYDYLVVATGPKLNFGAVPGLGPDGHTNSVCHIDHAEEAYEKYLEFIKEGGPLVVGAAQGASCYGPAYEMAFIYETDLRKRGVRKKVPITFITPEPYVGHMGLAGVGNSRRFMEDETAEYGITVLTNTEIKEVTEDKFVLNVGGPDNMVEKEIHHNYSMIIPSFLGIDAVANVTEMCNPKGFIKVNEFQENPEYPNIYGVGVAIAIAPVEATPVPTGPPKTGYMIESMALAAALNIKNAVEGNDKKVKATWNAICMADFGDRGLAFYAEPQMPPRNKVWAKKGKWVHTAKVAFEKYYMKKIQKGNVEPFFEKFGLDMMGIKKLDD